MHIVSWLLKEHLHYPTVTVVTWRYDMYNVKDVM